MRFFRNKLGGAVLAPGGRAVALAVSALAFVVILCAGAFLPRHPLAHRLWSFEIREGESCRTIAGHLRRDELIFSSLLFEILGRLRHVDTKIKAGEYRLWQDMSSWEILSLFLRGEVYLHRFMVRAGSTAAQLAEELNARGLVDGREFLALAGDAGFVRAQGIQAKGLEGYLFPDTYLIPQRLTAKRLVEMMLERFRAARPPDFSRRAMIIGLSEEKLVVLASIIEKEAKRTEEMPIIAAVFLNRLAGKMRLESCATVRYVVGYQRERLWEKDLLTPSPYNTYLHRGLPPGPICNPGAAALWAASHPAAVDYLYFVARGDGGHVFNRDYEGHLAAKRKYKE